MKYCSISFACIFFPSWTLFAAAGEMFPFCISYEASGAADISKTLDAPAGKNGFVRVENGRFTTDRGRIRFWGTNTCLGANFLPKEDSDKVADRLARLGTNCVRLHHMDSYEIWGGKNAKSWTTLDENKLDLLDYYIAALKRRGIYVNINLHVSRTLDERDGFPDPSANPKYNKGADNFYRPYIEADKKYARDLLEHVNPYTQTAYKDEPAVAMIEINNENSLIYSWCNGALDTIRDPVLAAFRAEWNGWLRKKYGNDAALRAAWKAVDRPLGDELAGKTTFDDGFLLNGKGWHVQTASDGDVPVVNDSGAVRIDIRRKGGATWLPQVFYTNFKVEKDMPYTVRLRMKANRETDVSVAIRQHREPWGGLGCDGKAKLTTNWNDYTFVFLPEAEEPWPRFVLGGMAEGDVIEIERISIRPGGRFGLPEGANLEAGTIPVFWKKDLSACRVEIRNDFCDFLLDLERRYWDEMYRFLKDEIGVRQPVSGTQLGFGGARAQGALDYCDAHAYTAHPVFPGKSWDMGNWYVSNVAIVNRDLAASLAAQRVEGRPFTVSEYNHPWPNRYAAEGFPIYAVFGAFQDWDGIFPFEYLHGYNIAPMHVDSFFDTAANTVQNAHMIAASQMFRYGEKCPEPPVLVPMTEEDEKRIFRERRDRYGFGFGGWKIDRRIALTRRTGVDHDGKITTTPSIPEGLDGETVFTVGSPKRMPFWRLDKSISGKGWFFAQNSGGTLFTGFVEPGKEYPFGLAAVSFGKTNLGWATVSMTPLGEGRFLLAATGEMLNTDMQIEYLENNRMTTGRRWGKPPILCEGISATFGFTSEADLRCWALDESGERMKEVPLEKEGPKNVLVLKPEYRTIWYEIETEN